MASTPPAGYAETSAVDYPRNRRRICLRPMLHHLGIVLQIGAMVFLPLLILYQLNFGFKLIVMPTCTIIGIVAFAVGTWLREKK